MERTAPEAHQVASPSRTQFSQFDSGDDIKTLKNEIKALKATNTELKNTLLWQEANSKTREADSSKQLLLQYDLVKELASLKEEGRSLKEELARQASDHRAEVRVLNSRLEEYEKKKTSQPEVSDAEVQTVISTGTECADLADLQARLQYVETQKTVLEKDLKTAQREAKSNRDALSRVIRENIEARTKQLTELPPKSVEEEPSAEASLIEAKSYLLRAKEAHGVSSNASNTEETASHSNTSSALSAKNGYHENIMEAAMKVIRQKNSLSGDKSVPSDPAHHPNVEHFDIFSHRSNDSGLFSSRIGIVESSPVDAATPADLNFSTLSTLNNVDTDESRITSSTVDEEGEVTLEQAPVVHERILPATSEVCQIHERVVDRVQKVVDRVERVCSFGTLESIPSGRAVIACGEADDAVDARKDASDMRFTSARVAVGDVKALEPSEDVLLGSFCSPEKLSMTESGIDRAQLLKQAQNARANAEAAARKWQRRQGDMTPEVALTQSSPAIQRYCTASLAGSLVAATGKVNFTAAGKVKETIRKFEGKSRSPSPTPPHPEVKFHITTPSCSPKATPVKPTPTHVSMIPERTLSYVPGTPGVPVPGTPGVPVPVAVPVMVTSKLLSPSRIVATGPAQTRAPSPPPGRVPIRAASPPPTRGARLEDSRPAALQASASVPRLAAQGALMAPGPAAAPARHPSPTPAQVRAASPPPTRPFIRMPDCKGAASLARPITVPQQAPRGRRI